MIEWLVDYERVPQVAELGRVVAQRCLQISVVVQASMPQSLVTVNRSIDADPDGKAERQESHDVHQQRGVAPLQTHSERERGRYRRNEQKARSPEPGAAPVPPGRVDQQQA